ncbi:MAG: hypothetical protein NTV34_04660, partial [Proteobacteria bacterium]|nr:hypothetical protein [Pseudomonadota bacterium]
MRNLWKVLVLFHFVVPFQFMLAGSVTGGNTGDPAMAEVEGARSFLLDLIPKFESHPWFDRLDLNISRYISQRKIPLVNALNAHDIDWVNESSVCIRSRPGAEFILESQVKSCFKLPRRFIIERILTELFLFDGLTSNTALDYSSKIASRAELHQKWLARNVYTTSIETGFLPTLKVLFSEGS